MLFLSILTSDRSRDAELWATPWQGQPPAGITVIGAYNLTNNRRALIWEGESAADVQHIDRLRAYPKAAAHGPTSSPRMANLPFVPSSVEGRSNVRMRLSDRLLTKLACWRPTRRSKRRQDFGHCSRRTWKAPAKLWRAEVGVQSRSSQPSTSASGRCSRLTGTRPEQKHDAGCKTKLE